MKTIQRISDVNALRRFSFETKRKITIADLDAESDWTVSNASIVYTGEEYYANDFYVINVYPSSAGAVTLTLSINDVFDSFDENEDFVFTCAAYCDSSIAVNAAIYDVMGVSESGNTRNIQGGSWGIVRSNAKTISPAASGSTDYSLIMTITGHDAGRIRISIPAVVNDDVWLANPVVQTMRPYIPGFYIAYDSLETDPNYPFLRLASVLTDAIADTMHLYSEWYQYDAREILPGEDKTNGYTRSRLTNYQFVSNENIDWLSQFSGSRQKKQIYVGGNEVVPSGSLSDFRTSQLYPAIYGRGAGTQSAIKSAVKFVLSGTKSVVISQHVGGDPWAMEVKTIASETPNLDVRTGVRLASTANVNIATNLAAGSSIDGSTLVAGDRILLKNQSTASQNGVYIASSSGAASRATDFDSSGEIVEGALFMVSEGSTNGDKAFTMTTTGTVTVGTTAINFSEFSGSPEILAVAEPARPLGYSLSHSIVEAFTLTLGDSEYGVLGTAVL